MKRSEIIGLRVNVQTGEMGAPVTGTILTRVNGLFCIRVRNVKSDLLLGFVRTPLWDDCDGYIVTCDSSAIMDDRFTDGAQDFTA